ncbi:NAD(P)H-hydrate dehydratase [Streptomyces pactum]|uniref:Bifunctional NAD(P)H-hydrate repair enzyme n=1 Tax=Streptomyces pactum TaxID=68249 RepID=A0ABS0NJH7_9ACTN|nr:NAD(P)H-hydrate dehydratase [Streptomyces pactum]MBH5335350.1 NAD(P)H-hydrate dehydratase [Streptomyces pactum]
MRTAYRVETVRTAERELMARLPEGALMRRAAAGLAAACVELLGPPGRPAPAGPRRRPRRPGGPSGTYGARVTLLVGSGDNGGDALYAGALLARRGAGVTAVLLSPDRAHPGGLRALRTAGGRIVHATTAATATPGTTPATAPGAGPAETAAPGETPVSGEAVAAVAGADLVIDGIVGIGGRGGLRPVAERLLESVRAPLVAVDLPSGVDADSGEVSGAAVTADLTVTFGAYKPGLLIDPAHERAGALRLIDIGLGPFLPPEPDVVALQHADIARLLPAPAPESDKYRRGVVGVVAGSARYPGAAVLAVAGALRGGAGAVRYVGPAADAVIARFPEALVHAGPPHKAGRVQAWVVGPGLGDDEDARRALADVVASDVPVLVDADGLRLLPDAGERRAPTLLTPHAGEAAALLGTSRAEVEANRLRSVRALAERFGATALLKGSTTLIASATGPARVNPTGTGWLATAGSGDVLSGLVGSLLAAGLHPRDAAAAGAYLHGLAARRVAGRPGSPITAHEVAQALPGAWADVRTG